jgi:hypothetical protein
MSAASRVPLTRWLQAVESPDGPLPEELRHVCLTLARFMSGDGASGCYPGTRTLALRVGVSHAAIGRRLKLLRDTGWLDVEPRRRQFGKPGCLYFPALPMERLSVPIEGANGTPERSNFGNGTVPPSAMERSPAELERSPAELERLSVTDSLTDSLTEKTRAGARESAASPAPAAAGSAAPTSEDLEAIRHLYLVAKYQPSEIWEKRLKRRGLTLEQVQAVTNHLDRAGKAT